MSQPGRHGSQVLAIRGRRVLVRTFMRLINADMLVEIEADAFVREEQ